MSFQDFVDNFERLEICNLGPEVFDEVSQMTGVSASNNATERWSTYTANGAWRSGETAGGCRNNRKPIYIK
jgi:calpain